MPTRFSLAAIAFLLAASAPSAAAADARLADAVEARDQAAVRRLLDQGVDVNLPQVDGMTALHWAAYRDELETARLLLRAGADPAAANRYGVQPLSLACANGARPLVDLLLAASTAPNTTLPGGETALMTAARTGDLGTVEALLSAGADVHGAEERRGQTALMWAAAEGHAAVVKALLAAGADRDKRLQSGFTALLFAVREGRTHVVRTLLDAGANVDQTIEPDAKPRRGGPRPGSSALLLAATNAHFELASLLLDRGANPNAQRTGYTVLHAVASVRKPGLGDNNPPPEGSGDMDSLEFVSKLVAAGADVNARMARHVNLGNTRLNKRGATPFLLAAHTGDAALMTTLADLGADPLLANVDGSTPLMAAAGLGTRSPGEDAGAEPEVLEAIRLAVHLGADLNTVDDNGETAMHGAAYKNLPAVVELLADLGADIAVWNRENQFGWTPLTIAQGYRFGNFKPSPVTVDALRRVMLTAGVAPPSEPFAGEGRQIY